MFRKGLLVILLVASALIIAGAVTVGAVTLGTGRLYTPPAKDLSFKPVKVEDLLDFKLELDFATMGRKIQNAKLETIEKQTSEVRELPLKKPVDFVECSENAIRVQTMVEFNEDTPASEIEADQKLLVALGLFPKGKSLEKVLTDVYTEQIAGSYDTETKKITIVAGKGTGGAMDQLTISHEVTHALQDQNFGLDKSPLDNEDYNGDNDLAITSLVEGDAMNTMIEYGRKYMTLSELQELSKQEVDSTQLDKAPLYLQRSLLFPYEEGMSFAQELASGGEKAVDEALADPPLSSEQIIHPEKYIETRDNPRAVPLADISSSLGEGWEKINEDCLGEFDIDVWFEEYVSPDGMPGVGEGWGGNTIQYYQGPGKSYVLVSYTVWDTTKDAQEFYDAYAKLLDKRFGSKLEKVGSSTTAYLYEADGQLFYCGIAGDATLCLQATDRATLDKAMANYPGFPPAQLPGI